MNKLVVSLAAAAALAVSIPAIAQQKASTDAKVAIPTKTFLKGQNPDQYLARDRLIGVKVQNKDGQVIGDIEDVILSKGNQVEGVIMGTGGFLGAGEKKIGVRYGALKFETKDGKTIAVLPAASKEVLTALDPYKRAEPQKTLLQKASEKAKELADKTKETVKGAAKKASDAVKPAEKKQ